MPNLKNVRPFPSLHVGDLPRLTLVPGHRRPAFRLEVDTPRRAVWVDAQGQTAARYLGERFGREEETGTYGEARSRRPASASTMITTHPHPTSISAMLIPGFSLFSPHTLGLPFDAYPPVYFP